MSGVSNNDVRNVLILIQVSRVIDSRMSYEKTHKSRIFDLDNQNHNQSDSDSSSDDGDSESNNSNGNIYDSHSRTHSKRTFLSENLHGSRRHLRKCAVNALQIVSEFGLPTIFLTVTCNAQWPELICALPPGQTAFDNPAISTLVFKKRLESLLHNIRNGVYFGGSKIVYIINSIEYQHRGLPHAHIVFQWKIFLAVWKRK
jgi:hypothetical protein